MLPPTFQDLIFKLHALIVDVVVLILTASGAYKLLKRELHSPKRRHRGRKQNRKNRLPS